MSRFVTNPTNIVGNPPTERLSQGRGGYVRPDRTLQDMLTPEQIDEKLFGYVQCPIKEVPQNCHVRYFSLSTDPKTKELKKQFRLGGFVTNKDFADTYVILSNGTKSWSVQSQTAIFYRKLSQHEVEMQHKRELERLAAELEEKTRTIERLVDTLTATKQRESVRESVSKVMIDENSTMTIPISVEAVTRAEQSKPKGRRPDSQKKERKEK